MSRQSRRSIGGYTLSPAPLVIDINGLTAGLAIQDKRGFRFIAAHPRFDILDGSFFRWPEHVKDAVQRLAEASLP